MTEFNSHICDIVFFEPSPEQIIDLFVHRMQQLNRGRSKQDLTNNEKNEITTSIAKLIEWRTSTTKLIVQCEMGEYIMHAFLHNKRMDSDTNRFIIHNPFANNFASTLINDIFKLILLKIREHHTDVNTSSPFINTPS